METKAGVYLATNPIRYDTRRFLTCYFLLSFELQYWDEETNEGQTRGGGQDNCHLKNRPL
jgi:hypothetical protein